MPPLQTLAVHLKRFLASRLARDKLDAGSLPHRFPGFLALPLMLQAPLPADAGGAPEALFGEPAGARQAGRAGHLPAGRPRPVALRASPPGAALLPHQLYIRLGVPGFRHILTGS